MDVPSAASRGLDPRGRHLLPGPSAAQLPPEDAARRHPPVRDEAPIPGGHPAPGQRAALSPHLCH